MKCKALFHLFIILASIFTVSSLAPQAEAQQQVCCEETTSGEHCQYTDQSNCKSGALQAATSCEQTSFCQLGCGFDSDTGRCFKNTPKATCQSSGDCTWTTSPSCDIPQCQRGCCVLSNQCSFVTQLQCKQITSQFPDINMTFDESITNEFSCINECRSFERGACVQPDGTCSFTTRNSCNLQTTALNATGPKSGFHPNKLCSHPELGTECAAQQYTGCLPDRDEVYWFDSCGNAENIYSSDKRSSYNNGIVLSKVQSCNPSSGNINSESCGNCNFAGGTLCGVAPRNINPTFGEYTCLDLSCKDLTVSATSPSSNSGTKKLGESWCAYDGVPGFGQDLVGSRHYRRLCINGEELTEPCKDFREEICVQGVQGQPPLPTQAAFQLSQGNYVEAICRGNRHTTCVESENEYDCTNLQARDCVWIGDRVISVRGNQVHISATEEPDANQKGTAPFEREQRKNEDGRCVPLVSPGLKFWPDESETPTSQLDPKSTCEEATTECEVTYEKPGLAGGVFSGDFGDTDWKCVSNCQCLQKDYLLSVNNICKSMGDCGAWYNVKGKFTEGGLDEDSEHDLLEEDVEDFESLISPTQGRGIYDSKFSAFFEQAAPGLVITVATGIGTVIGFSSSLGYGSLGIGEAFGQGFLSGFEGIFGFEALGEATYAEVAARSYGGIAFEKAATTPLTSGSFFTVQGGPEAVQSLIDEGVIRVVQGEGENAVLQATTEEGLSGVQQYTVMEAGTSSSFAQVLQFVNTLAWIYTIYSLLDVLLSDTKTEIITVTCEPWQAPTGGADCDKCDEDGKECSEYRCRSLGQMCKLLNAGTEAEACVNSNPNDATSPIISADPEALERGYTLSEVKGQGFTLNEKIEPFTAVSLGIKTNEYASCKYSESPTESFEEMTNTFGEGIFSLEHQTTFGLSSILLEPEALKLSNGGAYTLYLRCQDGNGNENNKPYYVKFSIKQGPDFTAPVIETTSIANGAYVPSGVNVTGLTIYTNEPSQCNWDDVDVEYEQMNNQFSCTSSQLPTTSIFYGLYDCSTILTNIISNRQNNYYFRCKDNNNNVNAESYEFSLQGTIPLSITSISPPPGTKFFTTDPLLKTSTAQGALNGVAVCGYSFIDNNPSNAIEFLKTNATSHEQQFQNLIPGQYNAFVTCSDVAGNFDQTNTTFTVAIDNQGPLITNLYTEGTLLHISTEENSKCEFSTLGSFNFGQGTPMTGDDTTEHETTLESSIYYIVCRDEFDNDASYKIFI